MPTLALTPYTQTILQQLFGRFNYQGRAVSLRLSYPRRGTAGCVRLHRDILQPETQARQEQDAVTRRVRTTAGNENRGRLENSELFRIIEVGHITLPTVL